MKTIVMRLLREPLLHFFAIGGLLFVLYANGSGSRETAPDEINISAARIDQLAAQFASVWRRPPTADELDIVVDSYVREEVYYRDALSLGLDKDDTVVRQRMNQKMEFLCDISAQMLDPTEAELQAYLAAHGEKYRQGGRRAIAQIFLGQSPARDDIEQALHELKMDPTRNTSAFAKRSLLPAELRLSRPEAIDSVYGEGFFKQIENFPTGEWAGPVVSSYGMHLVRVLDNQSEQAPPLTEIRAAVLRDWQADKARELRELDYAKRGKRFTIKIYGRGAQTKAAS